MKLQKITRIGLLMSVSQLLLTVFVMQWLFSQYKGEKELLTKDLYRQFTDSKQEVMDSMIVMNLIDPMLKDKQRFKVRLEINAEDTLNGKKFLNDTFFKDTVILKNRTGIHSPDTLSEETSKMITMRSDSDENNVLLHGVKMFVKKITSSVAGEDSIKAVFLYKPDTLLLKKIVAENFKKEGHQFKLSWISGNDNDSGRKKTKDIYFESNIFPKSYGLQITSYHFYLLKKISPQFLFGLILLLLTAASFLIAYRNLESQMRLNFLKNDFISNISHELKTPVSTVKVAIEALQGFDWEHDSKKTSEYLEMASQEMSRLDHLINKVLNISVLEDDKHFIHPEKTNLKLLIEEVLKSLKLYFSKREASVKFEPSEEDVFANIDKLHIQGALINLLDNSLKYSNEKPEIEIKLFQTNEHIYISVADNGPGIPQEYIEKIFDKFFRVPMDNRHDVKGYGLGLSYTAMVMKKHNGTITVKNRDAGGCLFTLTFPKV